MTAYSSDEDEEQVDVEMLRKRMKDKMDGWQVIARPRAANKTIGQYRSPSTNHEEEKNNS